jgi:hypothetical protein
VEDVEEEDVDDASEASDGTGMKDVEEEDVDDASETSDADMSESVNSDGFSERSRDDRGAAVAAS